MNLTADISAEQASRTPFLLINPGPFRGSYANVPYGLGVLAALLERNGIPVHVRDYVAQPYDRDDLLGLVRREGVKVVGMTMMTPQAPEAYRLLATLREAFPDLIFLAGGAHTIFLPREPLDQGFEVVFRREAEESLTAALPYLVEGEVRPEALGSIPGLVMLRDGELIKTGAARRITDLDAVPFPARHLFPFPEGYPAQIRLCPGPSAQFFTSRGCPERCAFCAQPYRDGVFYRSPENVLDEIEYVRDRFGITNFSINDDNFCHDNGRAIEICELMLSRGLDLPWVASFARIEPVCREMFQAMRRSGCLAVQFGVESGDPEVRVAIRKRGTVEDAIRAVRLAQEAGLLAGATFMFGHPVETREQAERTIRFARRLNADFPTFAVNCPYPGSADYGYFKKHGLLKATSWSEFWIQDKPIIRTKQMTSKELVGLRRKAYFRCYTSPRWWLRQARNFIRMPRFGLAFRTLKNIVMQTFSWGIAPKHEA